MIQLPPGSKPLAVPLNGGITTVSLSTDAAGLPGMGAGCNCRVFIGSPAGWTPLAGNGDTAVENGTAWTFDPLSVHPGAQIVSVLNTDPAMTLTVTAR